MSYYVNLGGIIIYGVTGVTDEAGRDITSYDGIEQGNFPVAESENLRKWTIECQLTEINDGKFPNWSAASKIFTAFEVLLKTKDSSRFIFTSDHRSDSLLVLLESYTKKETYSGAYDVTVRATEYKVTGIKTTDVPYISRPGKVPVPPKVTITSKNTAYKAQKKASDAAKLAQQGMNVLISRNKDKKPVTNPATIENGTSVSLDYKRPLTPTFTETVTAPIVKGAKDAWAWLNSHNDDVKNAVSSTFNSMGKAFQSFVDKYTY